MSTYPRRQVLGAAAGVAVAATLPLAATAEARPAVEQHGQWVPVPDQIPVPLDAYSDNDGIDTATAPGGSFDGSGYTFPGEELRRAPSRWTASRSSSPPPPRARRNNVVALGQRIDLPSGRYLSAHFLTAGSYGDASGLRHRALRRRLDDHRRARRRGLVRDRRVAVGPYRYRPDGTKDEHGVGIGTAEVWIDPQREAVALTLPTTHPAEAGKASLHLFALSLQPAARGRALALRDAHSTFSLLESSGAQSAEATPSELGHGRRPRRRPGCRSASTCRAPAPSSPRTSSASTPASRRASGSASATALGTAPGTARPGKVTVTGRGQQVTSAGGARADPRRARHDRPTESSLAGHQAPYWFHRAKFGIFIHWGVYSVPAWSPVGKQYAEWYWNHLQSPDNAVYAYHRDTYGENFAYDDFIPMFTAERSTPGPGWSSSVTREPSTTCSPPSTTRASPCGTPRSPTATP